MSENPKLRNLEVFPVKVSGRQVICMRDPLRITDETILMTPEGFLIARMFDGKHSVLDIQAELMRMSGELVYREKIEEVIKELDSRHMLDSDGFRKARESLLREFAGSHLREPAHAGQAYEDDPRELRKSMRSFFDSAGASGQAPGGIAASEIRGLVVPHIDLKKGGTACAAAYSRLGRGIRKKLFVILGTGHFAAQSPFILTKKDFRTPLGVLKTDAGLVDRIASSVDTDLFEEEIAHRVEHSIEFQVLFLQHVLEDPDSIRILPVLCSSFQRCMEERKSPADVPETAGFLDALKEAVSPVSDDTLFIASADLSHVGARFGDREDPNRGRLPVIENEDREMLRFLESADAEGFFANVSGDGDSRKICGAPAIYTMLKAAPFSRGELVGYYQWPEPEAQSVVTGTSMVFA